MAKVQATAEQKLALVSKHATLTDVQPFKINGVVIPPEKLIATYVAKIWSSAIVNKNKRNADNNGIKSTILRAIQAEIITKEEGFDIMLGGNARARVAELAKQLPAPEKSEDDLPTDEDLALAVKQAQNGTGQAS